MEVSTERGAVVGGSEIGTQRVSFAIVCARAVDASRWRGLLKAPEFRCIGSFKSVRHATIFLQQDPADLVLLACFQSCGLLTDAKQIRAISPTSATVLLVERRSAPAEEAMAQGLAECILPVDSTASPYEYIARNALRSRGKCQRCAAKAMPAPTEALERLNVREHKVLQGLARGLLYKEIAHELRMSEPAVHKLQHSIFSKLRVSNKTEAANLFWTGSRKRADL